MLPSEIILHHSLTKDSKTVSWSAIRRYHVDEKGWVDIGYHFGIELVGDAYEILSGRMLNEPGAHTIGHNNTAIGICFVGNFDHELVPPLQWHKGVKLVRSLCEVFEIPTNQVYGHRDFADKTCPGVMFNLDAFREELS